MKSIRDLMQKGVEVHWYVLPLVVVFWVLSVHISYSGDVRWAVVALPLAGVLLVYLVARIILALRE